MHRRGIKMWLKVTLKILLISSLFPTILFGNTQQLRDIERHFYQWHPEEAKPLFKQLEKSGAQESINTLYLKAKHAYLMGKYKESKALVDYIRLNFSQEQYQGAAKELDKFEAAAQEISKYTRFTTTDQKFQVMVPSGRNEILAPYALEVLQKAYAAYQKDFHFNDPTPVRLEILPNIETLDRLSGLTLKEIQTSGTIALAADNKVMIVSPAALIKGYAWRDTISHELLHWVVSKRTNNQTPIWIHEGIARFQETRWRHKPKLFLGKYSEHILATAHQQKHYISFKAMSPSLAKLPSQHDSALAYAQVATLMEWVYETYGYQGINKLLDGLKRFKNDRKAIHYAFNLNMNTLLKNWKKHIDQKGYRTYPGLINKPLLFKTQQGDQPYKLAEIKLFKNQKLKKWIRLGDMISEIGRFKAAKIEYLKALEYRKYEFPYIENRLATLYLKENAFQETIELITPSLLFFPQYLDSHMHLAIAHFNLKHYTIAKKHLLEALAINPFVKELHTLLLSIYKREKNEPLIQKQEQLLKYFQ